MFKHKKYSLNKHICAQLHCENKFLSIR